MVLKSLTSYLGIYQEKKKAGRPPKVSTSSLVDRFGLMVDRGYRGCEYGRA
jgi:hypothetical protein